MNRCPTALLLPLAFALTLAVAPAAVAAPRPPQDPLAGMIHRVDAFLHRAEAEGVTRDPRSFGNASEEIRLSVVSQLLAYCELYRAFPSAAHYQDIVARADF